MRMRGTRAHVRAPSTGSVRYRARHTSPRGLSRVYTLHPDTPALSLSMRTWVVVRLRPHARDRPVCLSGRDVAFRTGPSEKLHHSLGTQPQLVAARRVGHVLTLGLQRRLLRQEYPKTRLKLIGVRKVIGRHRHGLAFAHTGPSAGPGSERPLDCPGINRSILPQTTQRHPVLPFVKCSTMYGRCALHSIQPNVGDAGGSTFSMSFLFPSS